MADYTTFNRTTPLYEKCVKLLENAVTENKARPVNLAYLTDRIAVSEGKPQL